MSSEESGNMIEVGRILKKYEWNKMNRRKRRNDCIEKMELIEKSSAVNCTEFCELINKNAIEAKEV